MSEMRLQRALARAGVASRRAAEKLIDDGQGAGGRQAGDAGHEGGSATASGSPLAAGR